MTAFAAMSFETPGGVYNATPQRVVFAPGAVRRIAGEVERLGCSRALVVTTPGRGEMAQALIASLGPLCVGHLPEAVSQVPIELAREGQRKAAALGADCIVSFGGGASIGLGKGISLELGLPIIAVPTTYSGSEVTGFCGITIDGVKRMHTSLDMLARTVVYDPELTLSLPVDVGSASAMNALAHCIDAVYVPTVDPSKAFTAVEGAVAISEGARRVKASPGDIEGRTLLMYGAYLGGVALTGGFALQHGLAHTLGGSFGVPHGLSHAIVLPHVAAFNARHAPGPLEPMAAALGSDHLGSEIYDLLVDLGLPTRLSDVGIREDQVADIVRITVETDNGYNPVPVTAAAVEAITRDAIAGTRPA